MKFTHASVAGNVEILAADVFTAVPVKIAETDVVLAGTPITAAGMKDTAGTNAMGILLYDVDPAANPNGAANGFIASGFAQGTSANVDNMYAVAAQAIAAAPQAPAAPAAGTWTCPTCGKENDGNFCPACGTKKPE